MGLNYFGTVLLAFGGVVGAIKFNGPRATPINKRFDADGWTPVPTNKPKPLLELFKRQEDPGFCGYLEGDPDYPIGCDIGSSCMYDDVFSWFGCCTGTSITDCDVWTACVGYQSIDECLSHSSCYDDPLATACTDSTEPFCATLYTMISGDAYGHFICAESDTSIELISTPVGSDVSSFVFPTAVTGTDDFLTETDGPTFTRFATTTSTPDDEDETSTVDDESTEVETSTTRSRRTTTTHSTTESGSASPPPSNTAQGPPTQSTGVAVRTAEAMLGAAGGLIGMLAVLL